MVPAWLGADPSRAGGLMAHILEFLLMLPDSYHDHIWTYSVPLLLRLIEGIGSTGDGRRIAPRWEERDIHDWFNTFADAVMRSDRGTLLFAHFQPPHAPYVLTPTCASMSWDTM